MQRLQARVAASGLWTQGLDTASSGSDCGRRMLSMPTTARAEPKVRKLARRRRESMAEDVMCANTSCGPQLLVTFVTAPAYHTLHRFQLAESAQEESYARLDENERDSRRR